MVNSIHQWLTSGRDYATGLALYKVHGKDADVLAALEQGYSEYRHGRMIKELTALREDAERPAPSKEAPRHSAVQVATVIMPEVALEEKKDPYRDQWLPYYIEMNALRHRLEDMPTVKERGEAAHKILGLERKCMYWWERAEYYQATGKHMEGEVEESKVVVDKNALQRRLQTVRTYITKAKNDLKDPKKKEGAQTRLERYQKEARDIEKQLAA